ncbi:MAG: HAMP domain-containing sensor histidine kinase [Nitrososphaeraceae archaeon]
MKIRNSNGFRRISSNREVSDSSSLIKILHEPREILHLGGQMLDSSEKEILISVSSANTFLRQSKSGLLKSLFSILTRKKTNIVTIQILTPVNDSVLNLTKMINNQYPSIELKTIGEAEIQIQVTVLIIDRKSCLVIELRDDTRPIPEEAMGTAIYATSEPTVMSYFTIFETLWKQSELYTKLQIHEAAQREFFNLAAHELRTPIQPILGLSEEILRLDKGIDLTPYHKVILRNARRLQKLTENILDVTKIEGNAIGLKTEVVNVYSIISKVIGDFQNQINNLPRQKSVKILLNSDKAVPLMVQADRSRITQVLNNLISNAIWSVTYKYESNDGELEDATQSMKYIEISTERDDLYNMVIVSVKDNGGGIYPDIFPKLFTKFATKDERGLGLGLYICKGIVEAHGGKIWAESKEDEKAEGAIFKFTLPLSF